MFFYLHGLHFLVFLRHLPKPAGMRLDGLCQAFQTLRFPARDEREHPELETVLAARSGIQGAVIDDEFLASCISLELQMIESRDFRPGLVPFFVMPDSGIRFAFGYWPPGGTPGPHEHTAWTITAVCRNELEVLTYDRDESYRRRELVPKNCFPASAGKVGYIHKPCIHAPINKSQNWSLSFHATSPRDGEDLGDQHGPLPGLTVRARLGSAGRDHPYTSVLTRRRRMRRVHLLARTLDAMQVPQAPALLARCSALGSSATDRLASRRWHKPGADPGPGSGMRLQRVHQDLQLSCLCFDDRVTLYAETAQGPVEEITVDRIARAAITFVVREPVFDVRDIPGNLSQDERMALAEALEGTGLYMRRGDDLHTAN